MNDIKRKALEKAVKQGGPRALPDDWTDGDEQEALAYYGGYVIKSGPFAGVKIENMSIKNLTQAVGWYRHRLGVKKLRKDEAEALNALMMYSLRESIFNQINQRSRKTW